MATRGKLDREMDRHLGIRMQNRTGRTKPLTFTKDRNERDEHGEVRRTGLDHEHVQESLGKTETESDSNDESTACVGGFRNTEPEPG